MFKAKVLGTLILMCVSIECEKSTRLLLNDPQYIQDKFLELDKKIQDLTTSNLELKNSNLEMKRTIDKLNAKTGGGATYVRWGKKSCPANSTETVYCGYTGGSLYDDTGSAANYVCLHDNPDNGPLSTTLYNGKMYGAEYQEGWGNSYYDIDVPCCVCRSTVRPTSVMIPGKNQCNDDWTTEYKGYLASGYFGHQAASEYVCVDEHYEKVAHSDLDQNGKLFYRVKAMCGSLPCPPYIGGHDILCVVCTK